MAKILHSHTSQQWMANLQATVTRWNHLSTVIDWRSCVSMVVGMISMVCWMTSMVGRCTREYSATAKLRRAGTERATQHISSHCTHRHTHTHAHTNLMALCPWLPGRAGTRKVKPIWILLKQETVSGSGISWAMRGSGLTGEFNMISNYSHFDCSYRSMATVRSV